MKVIWKYFLVRGLWLFLLTFFSNQALAQGNIKGNFEELNLQNTQNTQILAQLPLTPDATLGNENSIVTPDQLIRGANADLIEGGAIRNGNLFHSFTEFNVNDLQRVYFANPNGINNILTRVTGNNISQILGTLGVNGNANLFLINPHGIYFGENAKLDISGSFLATTASELVGENGLINITGADKETLLTINPNVFFNANNLTNYQGDINNQGHLQTGQNLILQGNNLNLSGKLETGNDLILQGNNNVTIRDSIDQSFIASANGKLVIQGNQNIDIFALNHPDSGLFSGGNMVLRSTNTVGGDAHYWSGGNFSIEQLNGNLGSLNSPHDPIIRSSGDVSFNSYNGASLHILAGGSVNITGNINITGVDTTANSIIENVTLSDGTTVVKINGSSKPTLDIRAGTTAFGTIGITGNTTGFNPNPPNTTTTGTSADIIIGGNITNNNGLVFLTNQYAPNTSLTGGNIEVRGINTSTNNNNDAGNITINARNNIKIDGGNLNSDTTGLGKGGDINIITSSLLLTNGSYLTASDWNQGAGGTVNITASNSVKFDGGSYAQSIVGPSAVGNSGGVNISTNSLELLGGSYLSASTFGQGNAGTVNITASDYIKFDGASRVYSQVDPGALGNAGGINIATNSLELLGGSLLLVSTWGQGDAGMINIRATNSVKFNVSGIDSIVGPGGVGNAGGVNISTNSLELGNSYIHVSTYGQGNAGMVNITANNLNVNNTDISSSTFGHGNAGTVNITASNSVKFDGGSFAQSTVQPGAVGNAGGVVISTKALELLGGSYLSASTLTLGQGNAGMVNITSDYIKFDGVRVYSQVDPGAVGIAGGINISTKVLELLGGSVLTASTWGQGDAGTVNITASNSVKFDSVSFAQSIVGPGGVGNAGGVAISTNALELLGGSYLSASTFSQGNAGTVNITSDYIKFDGASRAYSQVDPGAVGNAGGVNISTNSLELLNSSFLLASTYGQGNAGMVNISATNSVKFDGISGADSIVGAPAVGNAGGVNISTNSLKLLGSSYLHVNTFGQGNAGTVNITANNLNVTDNSDISSNTDTSGNAGDLLITSQNLNLTNGATLSASTSNLGNGGSIIINVPQLVYLNHSNILTKSTANGIAGDIKINTANLSLLEGSKISASNQISSSGGINLQSLNSLLLNNSEITASTVNGSAGNLLINQNQNPVNKISLNQGILNVEATGIGNAGSLFINTYKLIAQNNSNLTASSNSGNANNIELANLNLLKLLNNSEISTSTQSGIAGGVFLNQNQTPVETIEINNSEISAQANQNGEAGNVLINSNNLNINNGGQISASNINGNQASSVILNNLKTLTINNGVISAFTTDGIAGNLLINQNQNPVNNISLDQGILNVEATGIGNAGSLFINTNNLTAQNNSNVTASTNTGIGNNITLTNLNNLELTNSIISAFTNSGTAGNILIDSTIVNLNHGIISTAINGGGNGIGSQSPSNIELITNILNLNNVSKITASTSGIGDAGRIKIITNDFTMNNNSTIETNTFSNSNAGNINIVSNNFNLNNVTISSSTFSQGNAGNIAINANNFEMNNNSTIATNTNSSGNGGNIKITVANDINMTDSSISASTSSNSTGNGGNINIDPINTNLNNSRIVVDSRGTGTGGSIFLTSKFLNLTNNSAISAQTFSSDGGNITLNISDILFLKKGGNNITATAGLGLSGGNGGNITIFAPWIISLPNQDNNITAEAFEGAGGNINITTNTLFGIGFTGKNISVRNDITASSQFGLSGSVIINTPAVDPTSGLIELPENLVDADSLFGRNPCALENGQIAGGSSFVIIGKGGLPTNPTQEDSDINGLIDLISLNESENNSTDQHNSSTQVTQLEQNPPIIQQAQGWGITEDGQLLLTAQSLNLTPQNTGFNQVSCHSTRQD